MRTKIYCRCLENYKKKKFKTFKSMLEFLVPNLSTENKSEGDCEADIEFFSMGFSGQSLRSVKREGHKYAVDMTSKEIWEYFDIERISPLFGREKEAREWADEYLPREYEQMSLFDEMNNDVSRSTGTVHEDRRPWVLKKGGNDDRSQDSAAD